MPFNKDCKCAVLVLIVYILYCRTTHTTLVHTIVVVCAASCGSTACELHRHIQDTRMSFASECHVHDRSIRYTPVLACLGDAPIDGVLDVALQVAVLLHQLLLQSTNSQRQHRCSRGDSSAADRQCLPCTTHSCLVQPCPTC